jgi:aldehyde dehydrogenase (NAD+)
VRETGLPVGFARGGLYSAGAHAAYWAQTSESYPWVEERQGISGVHTRITREPVGVVAAIVPWNAPVGLSASKIVPALIAACTVVLKPLPLNAVSLRAFGEAARHVGLPPGVLNVVPAGAAASDALARHPGVDKVAFAGSDRTGKLIAAVAAQTLKRVTLELGGKTAGIVLADAPLDRLVASAPPAFTLNNGEACAAMTRMLVPSEREDEIVSAIAAAVEKLAAQQPLMRFGPQPEHLVRMAGSDLLHGEVVVFGQARPLTDIDCMFDLYRAGQLPFDEIITLSIF